MGDVFREAMKDVVFIIAVLVVVICAVFLARIDHAISTSTGFIFINAESKDEERLDNNHMPESEINAIMENQESPKYESI